MKSRMPQASPPGSFWSLFDRPGGWVFFICFLGAVAGALLTQHQFVKGYKEKSWVESLTLPRPEYVKRLVLGYDAVSADLLFMRSVQAFGGIYENADPAGHHYNAIFNYFDVISELDPHFLEAYAFGNMVMGDESNRYDLALLYLKKGQWNNWRAYQPWYDAAYIKVYGAKEPDNQAKFFVRQAIKSKDAPDWVGRLEHMIDEQSGQFDIAMLGWLQTYANSVDHGDKLVAGIAKNRFATTINDWHKKILQDAADKYKKEQGKAANSLDEVAQAGYLPAIPICDLNLLQQNLSMFQAMQGKLSPYVEQIYESSVVQKGGILPNVTRPDDPYVLICMDVKDDRMVVTQSTREMATVQNLKAWRSAIAEFYKANNRYPSSLDELKMALPPSDPYCAGWKYDPASGIIVTPAREDL